MDRLRKYMKFRSERCFSFKSGDQEETSNKYSSMYIVFKAKS